MFEIGIAEKQFRRSLAYMAVFSLATNLLMLSIPLYMLQIYDRVLPSRSEDTLFYLTIVAALSLITLGFLEVVRSIVANRAAAKFDTVLSDVAVRAVIKVGGETGGNTRPVKDIFTLSNLLSSKVAFTLLDLPFATIFIAILYFIHPDLFWLTLAGAAFLFLLAIANQIATKSANKKHGEMSNHSNQNVEHLARNSDSLIAMGMINDTVNHWGRYHADSLNSADSSTNINAWFAGFSRIFRMGLQIAVLGYGAKLVLMGEMTPGMIFASSIISGRALQPIDQTIGSWRQLTSGWQAWKRTKGFLAGTEEKTIHTQLPEPTGVLDVKDLFQANSADPTKAPILQRVSFNLEAGESLAVIGPSGSGKTTLARMVVGALPTKMGSIRIDGHNLKNWDKHVLGRFMGYLAQDVEMLPGTIAQNISRFRPDVKDEEIINAARMAHVEQLIQQMPKGFDTIVGPGGARLSGGEKQRIGLARAFFGNPKLLVLDEPNANLDDAGNQALYKALGEAKNNGVTVMLITQRKEVLGAVDKILCIENGTVREFGEKREVLEAMYPKQNANKNSPTAATSHFAKQYRANVGQMK